MEGIYICTEEVYICTESVYISAEVVWFFYGNAAHFIQKRSVIKENYFKYTERMWFSTEQACP
jgi:hypothetical protein